MATSGKNRSRARSREAFASASSAANSAPRLGMVLRFNPQAHAAGIRALEVGGFRVATSSDFKHAASVPHDFDGADVQVFERFGIAVVRADTDRITPMLKEAMESKVVSAARQERLYRAMGERSAVLHSTQVGRVPSDIVAFAAHPVPDYLNGYRDATNQLIDRILAGGAQRDEAASDMVAETVRETSATWGLQAIKVPATTLTGAGIKVAVLDTGFDDSHPDFIGRAVTKKLFASNSTEGDVHGHGTHCIGTACGPLSPRGVPRYGIAYEAEIYAGKVLGDDGFGTDRSILAGIDWALDQGCPVISMSLGLATNLGEQPSDDYEVVGQVCLDSGSIIVAAAGNESARPGKIAPVCSPANATTILAVGAVDPRFRPAVFSCGGMNPGQEVDIAAPGIGILSSLPGNQHDRWDGTSMATPHVAGVAALIAGSDPKYRGWALWARLLQLARPIGSPARDVGKGLLRAPKY